MRTKEITVNGKQFTAHEVVLDSYPECMEAFSNMRSEDRRTSRDAVYIALQFCAEVPLEDAKLCTLSEMNAAIDTIREVNGIAAPPKVEAEPEAPTTVTT